MDNKQKRKLFSSIYRTITFFSFLALALTMYLAIDKISKGGDNVFWLDVTIISVCGLLLLYLFIDNVTTKKVANKYGVAKMLYTLFLLSFMAGIVLAVYCYLQKVDVLAYVSYALPLGLMFIVELVFIVNFTIGLYLTKLNRNSTIIVDSTSEVPNFDDEVLLKKKLNELNRKLEMKKIQDQIDQAEKKLEEK